MSLTEAQGELGVSGSTLYRWLRDGFVAGTQLTAGGPWHIRVDDELRAKITPDIPPGWMPLAEFWDTEREGPDEIFTLRFEIIAAQDPTAVARIEVIHGEPPLRTYRDLWVITLAEDGRCSAFEEWPFHPGQARTAF